MSSDVLRVIDPRGYFDTFFKEGVYPDGRGILDVTKLVYKQGECGGVGSAVVTNGGVTVSCSIEASISLSSDASLVSVEIAQSQQLSEKDSEDYRALILDLFNRDYFVKRENLKCIDNVGNKLPLDWVLTVTVKILSLDGSILDAVVCAIIAALKDTRLPNIRLNHAIEDESPIEKTQILLEDTNYSLNVHEILMCCTFGVFVRNLEKDLEEEILLFAPSEEITGICRATVSIVVGNDSKIVLTRLRGHLSKFDMIRKMTKLTEERRQKFIEALKQH
ncbi:unnamed protein product [Caenorhabditis bovis]|uniref:Ribosomal RNA-processing protein 43 n=1 Tax=Caenorhabditis bovis TaxID=2654633 RepID=A0A8S1EVW1_9PELO|nr:unnamed protein product [Caenorhabditis bovis]